MDQDDPAGQQAPEKSERDVCHRVRAVDVFLRRDREEPDDRVRDGVEPERAETGHVFHQPDPERPEQRRVARRVDRDEHHREQYEVRPRAGIPDAHEIPHPDLQADDEVDEDEVGEPAHIVWSLVTGHWSLATRRRGDVAPRVTSDK
jgi:hypothetical protein